MVRKLYKFISTDLSLRAGVASVAELQLKARDRGCVRVCG